MAFFWVFIAAVAADSCTPDMLSVGLTQCTGRHTRSAVFYKNATNCEGALPSPITDLNCDLVCPPGTFLGVDIGKKQSTCQNCPENTFSNGGGVQFSGFDRFWTTFEDHFISYCYVSELLTWIFKKDCSSWTFADNGASLISGNTTLRAWVESQLIYYADIVKPGSLTIQYKKKTRMYNGSKNGYFGVFVNEAPVLEDDRLEVDSWQSVTVPLSVGMTEITIIYEKFSAAGFDDLQGSIRYLEVRGTALNALICSPCNNGYSQVGSDSCQACAANQYYDFGQCQQCPDTTYSPSGSTGAIACKLKLPCAETDYSELFTGCLDGLRTKHYEWHQPHICNEATGVVLPSPVVGVACDKCPPGNYYKPISTTEKETVCVACESGTATTGSDGCTACDAGSYAPRILNFTHWNPLPGGVTNECHPYTGQQCSSSTGWISTALGLTSGSNLDTNCYLILTIVTNTVEDNSWLQVQLSLSKSDPESRERLIVEVDGNVEHNYDSNADHLVSSEFKLSPGSHVIKLIYHHMTTASPSDFCFIHWIAIKGSDKGGAPKCETCTLGSYSTAGSASCTPCSAGYTSNGELTACVLCPDNAYSNLPGNPLGCQPCPGQTVPNTNRTLCIASPQLNLNGTVYKIENLTGIRGSSEGYASGLCSKDQFKLFCQEPFYGPVHSNLSDFYLSVLNPAKLTLGMYNHYDDSPLGYVYGVINKSELTLSSSQVKAPDEPCVSDFSKLIVNLGSKVESVEVGLYGFNVTYVDGSLCSDQGKFSAEVVFMCDKREGDGFPELSSIDTCRHTFKWKSRLACPICLHSELREIKGQCVDGIRYIYYVEGKNCILENQDRGSLYLVENCSVTDDIIGTTVALVVIGFLGLLLFTAILTFVCFCKFSRKYQALLEHKEEVGGKP